MRETLQRAPEQVKAMALRRLAVPVCSLILVMTRSCFAIALVFVQGLPIALAVFHKQLVADNAVFAILFYQMGI